MKSKSISDPRIEFFDSIADKWDAGLDLPVLAHDLDACLAQFDINESEVVLDVGCGTGNLTKALLRRLGPAGRVMALDISTRMLALAQGKVDDVRASWHHASAEQLPFEDASIDRVICFSVWPHFENHASVAREFHRVLRPDRQLHIVHLISRAKINRIHEEVHHSVKHDHLVGADETADLLTQNLFNVVSMTDDEQRYIITACKKGWIGDSVP